jgi:hypothetical protein
MVKPGQQEHNPTASVAPVPALELRASEWNSSFKHASLPDVGQLFTTFRQCRSGHRYTCHLYHSRYNALPYWYFMRKPAFDALLARPEALIRAAKNS